MPAIVSSSALASIAARSKINPPIMTALIKATLQLVVHFPRRDIARTCSPD
jgi:hypothetical protein